ncbi:MAG: hypothetical protein MUE52_04315 [Tabrizicola sp.]|nr:hypothetical protein [Tabrizicola sp.]
MIDLIKDRPEDMPVHDRLRAIGCGIGAAMTIHSALDLHEAITCWTPLMEGIQEGFRLVSTAAAEREASGKGAVQ